MLHRPKTLLLPLASMVFLVACGGEEPKKPAKTAGAIPESYWSEAALTKATRVRDIRRDAKDGAEVVVTGKVKDFVSGVAAFTLIDLELKSCSDREGDTCPTPWDYCCEEANVITENTIMVMAHDSNGRPLRTVAKGFQGFHGLDHLETVTLTGKASRDKQGNVTVVLAKLARVK